MLDNRNTYPALSNYLSDVLSQVGMSYDDFFHKGMLNEIGCKSGIKRLNVVVELNKDTTARSIAYSDDSSAGFDIAFSDLDNVDVNQTDVDKFISEAQDGIPLAHLWDNPLGSLEGKHDRGDRKFGRLGGSLDDSSDELEDDFSDDSFHSF